MLSGPMSNTIGTSQDVSYGYGYGPKCLSKLKNNNYTKSLLFIELTIKNMENKVPSNRRVAWKIIKSDPVLILYIHNIST